MLLIPSEYEYTRGLSQGHVYSFELNLDAKTLRASDGDRASTVNLGSGVPTPLFVCCCSTLSPGKLILKDFEVVRQGAACGLQCPKGHALQVLPGRPVSYPGGSWMCDACGERIPDSTPGVLHCGPCTYDVCPKCQDVAAGFDVTAAKGAGGFKFTEDNTSVAFPVGPITAYSDFTVGSGICTKLTWTIRVRGNSSWCIGVVPVANVGERDFLYRSPSATVGFTSAGCTSGTMAKADMHDKQVKVVVDTKAMTATFSVDGTVLGAPKSLSHAQLPAKLGLCGFNGTVVEIIGATT